MGRISGGDMNGEGLLMVTVARVLASVLPQWLLDVPVQRGVVLAAAYTLTGLLLVGMLVPLWGLRGRIRFRLGFEFIAAGIGALMGLGLVWYVVDVQDVFGVDADTVILGAAALGGAGVGVAVSNLVLSRSWRKILAVMLVLASLASAGLMINRDVAYYPTLGDVLGITNVKTYKGVAHQQVTGTIKQFHAPASLPSKGEVSMVSIPANISHFKARAAMLYLPPAALVKNPPPLPVVIALSGQPGSPSDVFEAGRMASIMDAIAAQHHGVAPIVVVPDQLGSYRANPMCVNSKLGNSATYIMQDVRAWILDKLPVTRDRRGWTVAGFSQGATCAVQFATAYPGVFGSFVAVSSELGPRNGDVAHTIKVGFHGSLKAFAAAQPIDIMAKHGQYKDLRAVFAVGALDKKYGADTAPLVDAARVAGMQVSYKSLSGLAHNWNTGYAGLQYGLDLLVSRWGLG